MTACGVQAAAGAERRTKKRNAMLPRTKIARSQKNAR